ncbi:MAG TPA: hypothetical protein VK897_12835 [Anaerolineales bacterium]|nr:hypothetical protein [Anaerolineales bacterium]
MHSTTLTKTNFWIFLSILSVLAMILAGIATSKYGAGVSSDATKYLSVAQNLLDGNGLYDHKGGPLLSWPPLYSTLLAGLSLITGLDVFVFGWYFNVFLLGLNLFLSGVIFARVFRGKPFYAYLATLFVFLSISALRIHANISSDPFYQTLVLGFLVAAEDYVRKRSYAAFAWMVLFSVLAPLQRYAGLSVTVAAELVILIENRRSIRTLLRDGFILGFASVLPIAWWLFVRNVMTYGSLYGVGPQTVEVWANISMGLTKMLHWFVPYLTVLMPVLTRPHIPLGILALILLVINRNSRQNGRAWIRSLSAPSVYPTMVHAVVYFLALAVTVVTADHRDLYSDRYYVILLVPVAILILLTFDTLVLPHLKLSPQQVRAGLILIFLLWAIYPFYSFSEYLREARKLGEPSGANMFNNQTYNEMDVVAEMRRLREIDPDKTFYSNYSDAVWFWTRKPVTPSVIVTEDPALAYAGWPHDKPGYIIWFEPNEYKHYLPPEEIAKFANVELVYQGKGGKIYYVQAR